MENKYKFIKVYKRISKRNEPLKYELINENMEMDETAVDSLLRASFASIKSVKEGLELYYNM